MEVLLLSRPDNSNGNKPYYLPLLLIISIASHFPFVLKGFGEIDATKIAVSVIDMLNNGPGAVFANFYFSDVIPLYILYLKWSMKLLDHNYTYLPLLMNYTNACFGTLTVIPAFILIRKAFGDPVVAFCSVLALIFAPSFYQSTITGFPHLISFFFLLTSLCFYLSGLDKEHGGTAYLLMAVSCLFLTVAFLFKSDIVLASGAYIGFLFMRKTKDKGRISAAFIIILVSGVLFLILRNLIIGDTGGGTTMSKDALSHWYNYSLIIPGEIHYFIRQAKPVAYGAGIVTFFLGIASLVYFLLKRRRDVLAFVLPWALTPVVFWMVMIGNNARHNMITTLPFLAAIIWLFREKAGKFTVVLTVALILGNFFITPPSFSILTPSGNLFKSVDLLEERVELFRSRAEEIAGMDEDRIAVLGYFHNPHVVFELLRSAPSYEARKIGREDYEIKTGGREYVFLYFVAKGPEEIKEGINTVLKNYDLKDYIFTSAMYDLTPLAEMGLKTRTLDILIQRSGL